MKKYSSTVFQLPIVKIHFLKIYILIIDFFEKSILQ